MHDYFCGNIDADGNPVLSYAAVAYSLYFYDALGAYPFDSVGYEPGCYPVTFGASGSIDVLPIVAVKGDRTAVSTDVSQIRLVLGMKGDLTLDGYEDWSYEASAYRTESTGESFRSGIRGDKLSFGLGWDPSYGIGANSSAINYALSAPCAVDELMIHHCITDVLEGCVAIDMFAPSLYNGVIGEFATQAEYDYVWGQSIFTTDFNQTVLSGYLTGTIGEVQLEQLALLLVLKLEKMRSYLSQTLFETKDSSLGLLQMVVL